MWWGGEGGGGVGCLNSDNKNLQNRIEIGDRAGNRKVVVVAGRGGGGGRLSKLKVCNFKTVQSTFVFMHSKDCGYRNGKFI